VAYMLAAPIINPVVIGSTWAAFSGDRSGPGGDGLTSLQMVSLRVGLGFITAFVVGLVLNRVQHRVGLSALVKPILGSHDARFQKVEEELEEKITEKGEHAHGGHHHEHGEHGHHHAHEHGEHTHEHGEHGHHHDHGQCEHHHHEPHVHEHAAAAEHGGATKTEPAPEAARHHTEHSHIVVSAPRDWTQRLMNISETALHDFVDITCFLILGAIIAGVVQTFRLVDKAPDVTNPFLAAPVMMAFAILVCLCSEADAFVAANLIQIPLAGKIAFLVLGPMLDLKLYLMYTRVFRTRLIWTIIPCVCALVLVLSLAAHFLTEWRP
jgi:uncharacterized membrane protein YraQ (UPF0718 family)